MWKFSKTEGRTNSTHFLYSYVWLCAFCVYTPYYPSVGYCIVCFSLGLSTTSCLINEIQLHTFFLYKNHRSRSWRGFKCPFMRRILTLYTNQYLALSIRILFALIFMQLTRLWFYIYNEDLFSGLTNLDLARIALSGTPFDLSAVCYVNCIYILMMLPPYPFVFTSLYRRIADTIFAICNCVMLVANLADAPFYRFTGIRTQAIHIAEVLQDEGAADMMMGHFGTYWQLLIGGVLFLALFLTISLSIQPTARTHYTHRGLWKPIMCIIAILAATFLGMRGGLRNEKPGGPLGVDHAARYCKSNQEIPLVLNTPFSILRTIGSDSRLPQYDFYSEDHLTEIRNNIHFPLKQTKFLQKNIVMIILEGVGCNYIESFNPYHNTYPIRTSTLTPFIDSLATQALCFTNFYAPERKSSAGLTAILGGMPAYLPFIYFDSPYQRNQVETAGSLLSEIGYSSALFHGGNKGAYNIQGMAEAFGYETYYDRTDYESTYGDAHYDNHWGIYDDAMSKFILDKISALPSPFLATWFTLSTHSPYVLPKEYTEKLRSPHHTMQQTVEYIDIVLQDFFAEAAKQPWYTNTIFVITADHSSMVGNPLYDGVVALSHIPLLIYTPDGTIKAEQNERVGNQIDINATLLDLLGYPKPYFSLGESMLRDDTYERFALVQQSGDYWLIADRFVLQIKKNTFEALALYNYIKDPKLDSNLLSSQPEQAAKLLTIGQAFIQDYTDRLIHNKLTSTSSEVPQ